MTFMMRPPRLPFGVMARAFCCRVTPVEKHFLLSGPHVKTHAEFDGLNALTDAHHAGKPIYRVARQRAAMAAVEVVVFEPRRPNLCESPFHAGARSPPE